LIEGKKIMATPKNPVTIYTCGAFGTNRIEANLVEIVESRTPGVKIVKYVVPPKRKPKTDGDVTTVVLAGHGHPKGPETMVKGETTGSGFSSESTKYLSFDSRYNAEYNVFINALLPKLDPTVVLLDQRKDKSENPRD
jgi:hypothetical protein